MNEKIHLWPEEIVSSGDSITVGAIIENPGGKHQHLWYRLPAAYREAVTKSCDPFVLGMLFSFMKTSADVLVHGQVSPSLLRNLVEFQDTWARWDPAKYRRIEISADVEREDTRAETNEAIMGFSGGADSAYTAWRHRTGQAGRHQRNLVAGVMLHGFDIPLAEAIAGAYDYAHLVFPCGSNPITDGMMSSDSFQIVHDGAALDKMEKLGQIQKWPEALKYLRVCYLGRYAGNCCRCFKCVKTMMMFRVIRQDLPECFERDISDAEILRLRYPNLGDIQIGKKFVEQAKNASIKASWLRAFQFSVLINRLRLSARQVASTRKLVRGLYRFFFPPL